MTKSPAQELFDRVVVVSLRGARDRRAYIREHLPTNGFPNFEFFDAVSADGQRVRDAYDNGEVFSYPPCFRCGKLDCGKPDCNNYLIPAQVATYLTYRKLWQRIASEPPERILVVEDDVRFQPHVQDLLGWLKSEIDAGRLPFHPTTSCLLRLGWGYSEAHEQTEPPYYVDRTMRMANPCHALTTKFAKNLLKRHRGINHTVDVFQHRQAPEPGEAYTVNPPIASELSWREGVFDSAIHPREARESYLDRHGQQKAAENARRRRTTHVKKKHYRPILIIGHPRCGTGYAANLCRQMGLDVGHEKLGSQGISSWMFAVEAEQNPYALDQAARTRRALAWEYLILAVRNLYDAVPSVIRDSTYAPPSYDFRRTHILSCLGLDLDSFDDPVERAVWSVTSWARISMTQAPDLVFRIEDQHEKLRQFLADRGLVAFEHRSGRLVTTPVNQNKAYKGVRYPKPEISQAAWDAVNPATKAEIAWYNKCFEYSAFRQSADERSGKGGKYADQS